MTRDGETISDSSSSSETNGLGLSRREPAGFEEVVAAGGLSAVDGPEDEEEDDAWDDGS